MNSLIKVFGLAFASMLSWQCFASQNSDCAPGRSDSTCGDVVSRPAVPLPFPPPPLYNGAISGTPISGSAYWGFDFVANELGIPSPAPRDMFVNRSSNAISLLFTFDLPNNCGSGCLPGMEFKLNSSWNSFFPNIVVAGSQAITTLQVAPGQTYGFVISLWGAKNPRIRVDNLGATYMTLRDAGLADFATAQPVQGTYFTCECGDGVQRTCYSGTRYSNGLMGSWYRDRYVAWDAVGCN